MTATAATAMPPGTLAVTTVPVATIAVDLAATAPRLANGELRLLPLGSLTLRPRQRGTDQPAMHRTVFNLRVLAGPIGSARRIVVNRRELRNGRGIVKRFACGERVFEIVVFGEGEVGSRPR